MGLPGIVFGHQAPLMRPLEAAVSPARSQGEEERSGVDHPDLVVKISLPDPLPGDPLHFAPPRLEVEQATTAASWGRVSGA